MDTLSCRHKNVPTDEDLHKQADVEYLCALNMRQTNHQSSSLEHESIGSSIPSLILSGIPGTANR